MGVQVQLQKQQYIQHIKNEITRISNISSYPSKRCLQIKLREKLAFRQLVIWKNITSQSSQGPV